MVHKVSLNDFRAVRCVLDSVDFGLAPEGPNLPPADMIDEDTWHGLMDLPDDVAIRTTDSRGSAVRLLYRLHSAWLEAMPQGPMIGYAMLEAADAFDASIFNLVHGYYKQATGALRDALELMTLACLCEITADAASWAAWNGGGEVKFNQLCDRLQNAAPLRPHEARARTEAGTSLFAGDNGAGRNAWARDLYRRLSHYAHARSGAMNGHIWESNGPIYAPKGFALASDVWLETHAISLFLARIAKPDVPFLVPAAEALLPKNVALYTPAPFVRVCQSYVAQLVAATP